MFNFAIGLLVSAGLGVKSVKVPLVVVKDAIAKLHHGAAGPCWHLHNLSIIVIVRFEDEFSLGVKSVKDAIAKK